jgi:hypothetical protein
MRKHHVNTATNRVKRVEKLRGLPGLSPAVREEFFELLDGTLRKTAEHIAEPGKRIELVQTRKS